MSERMSEVVHDTLDPTVRLSYGADEILVRTTTPYQDVVLLDNERFGRVLLLDGATQLTTADEFIYHEMLAHVPIFSHGDVRDVLIIGGGDCGLAEEVLKHKDIRRVVQVELDPCVVDLSRRYLDEINAGVFADERFQLNIHDGATFIDGMAERFDLVLVDSTDPVGDACKLFSAQFYKNVRRCLRMRGILVVQAGVPFLQPEDFSSAMRNLASVFRYPSCYLLASPSYVGGHLALGWASDSISPAAVSLDVIKARHAKANLKLRYYTPEVDRAAFALPGYINDLFTEAIERR
ncbi:MAG: polyamine aminopropyltransferase [Xanthomonadaceae bacterium]|nr:polyamine aminopropyltransferase [Xanthomonadaceae bacterium]